MLILGNLLAGKEVMRPSEETIRASEGIISWQEFLMLPHLLINFEMQILSKWTKFNGAYSR